MDNFQENDIEAALRIFNRIPEAITWKDKNFRYVLMDDQTAKLCGYKSSAISFEGVTDYDLPCRASEFADDFRKADQEVLSTNEEISGMCFCSYSGNEWRLLLGRTSPYFNGNNDAIGIQTIALDVSDCVIMRSAFSLFYSDYNTIGNHKKNVKQVFYSFKNSYDDYGLTNRQSEILFFIIRGYTAKEIAKILTDRGPREIYYRTVQHHIAEIKMKMGCDSRSQIIAKAIESGLGTIIPKSLVTLSFDK